MPLVIKDAEGKEIARPDVRPPPWWRAKKKAAIFYNGMARGEHRGTMEPRLPSAYTLDEAKRVDRLFETSGVHRHRERRPTADRSIEHARGAAGDLRSTCSGCHISADAPRTTEHVSNLLIPLDVVGTDSVIGTWASYITPAFVGWYTTCSTAR
jgi:hypothetical protein